MELFELYTKGFLEECREQLTTKEIELLPMGAKVMTFECGIRFLTDYLEEIIILRFIEKTIILIDVEHNLSLLQTWKRNGI